MSEMYYTRRHWSRSQQYATGDILAGMINDGWFVETSTDAPHAGKAPMYNVVLTRDGEKLDILVLDSPVVRDLI